MESLPPSVINRRWILCAVSCFLGYMLLSFSLRKVSLPTAMNASLPDIEITESYSMESPAAAASTADLAGTLVSAPAPQPVAAATSSAPSNLALVMNSSSSGGVSQTLGPSSAPEAETTVAGKQKCDVFDGRWVYDRRRYPLYRAHWCPFLSDQVSCQRNGRPDSEYEHWRWQPNGCDLPSMNGSEMLERLRGKRVVMVGDSLNRNMWESLACILYSAVRRPTRAVVQVHASDYKLFRALDYECWVEFYWSPFLVELQEREGDHAKILRLDKLPLAAHRWVGADVMVFNTGHWWTHQGKMRAWNYFEYRDEVMEDMEINVAFNRALRTWSRWVDRNVDPRKTTVFFRSISPEHNRKKNWCYNQMYPITTKQYMQSFSSSILHLIERTIHRMAISVTYLNITQLSEYRIDGHTAIYTSRQGKLLTTDQQMEPLKYADCSHWCLPGIPDIWNVLLFTSLRRITTSSFVSS